MNHTHGKPGALARPPREGVPARAVRGRLFVVSGPSGAGKTTVVDAVVRRDPTLRRAVTSTTRAPRGAERDGVDYYFLSQDEFARRLAAGRFLEYASVHGRLYGTERSAIDRTLAAGHDAVVILDVVGAAAVRRAVPDAITLFLAPPSLDALERRLRSRASAEGHLDEADLRRRLTAAGEEMARAEEFAYRIVNDDLGRAATEVLDIVARVRRNADLT